MERGKREGKWKVSADPTLDEVEPHEDVVAAVLVIEDGPRGDHEMASVNGDYVREPMAGTRVGVTRRPFGGRVSDPRPPACWHVSPGLSPTLSHSCQSSNGGSHAMMWGSEGVCYT